MSLAAAIVWTWAYGFCTDASFNGTITYTTEGATLTIKYQTTDGYDKEKKGAIKITGKTAEQTAEEIRATATGAENYYSVTDPTSKIRYYFKLKNPLTTGTPTPATIIVDYEYGHIFAEGFGGTDANPSMISPLLIVLVGMGLVYGICLDTQKENVTTYDKSTISYPNGTVPPKGIDLKNLKAQDINSITITDKEGKSTTYNKQETEAGTGPGTATITITKDGRETTAYFKQGDPDPALAPPDTPKNSIILKYTLKGGKKTITITGKTTTASVHYGHIFTEKFDTSRVHPHIVSPTLMVIVGMGLLISTIFPSVIIAVIRLKAKVWSPQHNLVGFRAT